MLFPFTELPTELACKIVKHAIIAGSTSQAMATQTRNEGSRAASSLALVSTFLRAISIPYLLSTVILSSHNAVILFLQALQVQHIFMNTGSRLELDYPSLIQRFWSSIYYEPSTPQARLSYDVDYRPLYNVLYNIGDLGFDFGALHLLAEALELRTPWTWITSPVASWTVTRITLSGHPRWLRLTSVAAGLRFLQNLTHLTLWGPVTRAYRPAGVARSSTDYQVPDWVAHTPFNLMHNLTHFAHTLIEPRTRGLVPLVAYVRRQSESSGSQLSGQQVEHGGLVIAKWIFSPNPLSYGRVRIIRDFGTPIPEGAHISREISEAAFDRREHALWPGS